MSDQQETARLVARAFASYEKHRDPAWPVIANPHVQFDRTPDDEEVIRAWFVMQTATRRTLEAGRTLLKMKRALDDALEIAGVDAFVWLADPGTVPPGIPCLPAVETGR